MGKEDVQVYDDVAKKVDSSAVSTHLVDKILELNDKYDLAAGNNVEVDIYYNKIENAKSELLLVGDPLTFDLDRAELESKGPDYVRIGTIGNVDLASFKEIVRIVDKDLGVYEMNDGLGIKHNQSVYANLNKRVMKRTFIDSSFGIKEDLRNFLVDVAKDEKWYSVIEATLETIIKENELINIDPS